MPEKGRSGHDELAGRRPPSMSAADVPELQQLGEYKLLEKLGEGGMGTVHKAWHTELDRVVAVKVLAKDRIGDEQAVARFRREMKAAGRFDHPNIVRAHDARKIGDTHFLVMEYVDGLDLAELLRRLEPVPIADACELIRQAALGLQCAHEHGLVHRDIKPSNLMVTGHGQVKILDLGLARGHAVQPAGEAMTAVGQVMGTPDFMAPEQVSDSHTVDIRADVYSLGCTLYMLLTGQAPFGGPKYRTAFEKMVAHTRDPVLPIRQLRHDVPEELADTLDRMLAKTPEQRFATPGEVADAVGRLAAGADPAALLAKAQGRTKPSGIATKAVGVTGTAASSTTAPARLDPLRPPLQTPWRWNKRLTLSAGVILVVLGMALAGIVISRIDTPDSRPGSTAQEDDAGRDRTPAAAVAPGQLPGWIVLSWTRPRMGKPSLWLISPDGRRRAPVTTDPDSFDVHPSFSPDGRRIAFIRGRDPAASNGVWVCNVDGSQQHQLVSAGGDSERFFSPVWVSNSRIYYARDPRADRLPDMEIWQVDLDGNAPRRVFGFAAALDQGGGLVTDASPDGRQLVVIAQDAGAWATADVYLTDLGGKRFRALWSDRPDQCKDARALWSPDGKAIAWHHNFTAAEYGVGLARLEGDGQWSTQLQAERDTSTTPLAWSPEGHYLLCARIHASRHLLPPATVVLMDKQFRSVGTLFELKTSFWRPNPRDFGRLADWAVVPDGALPAFVQPPDRKAW